MNQQSLDKIASELKVKLHAGRVFTADRYKGIFIEVSWKDKKKGKWFSDEEIGGIDTNFLSDYLVSNF